MAYTHMFDAVAQGTRLSSFDLFVILYIPMDEKLNFLFSCPTRRNWLGFECCETCIIRFRRRSTAIQQLKVTLAILPLFSDIEMNVENRN